MGIKTVPQPPYSPDLAPCEFGLFPKLRGCHYKIIEEMKEAVTKVVDTLTQEDFHGDFLKLLEQYNKCIVSGGDYFQGNKSFMCVLLIEVPIRKKSGNLFNDPRICITFTRFALSIHPKCEERLLLKPGAICLICCQSELAQRYFSEIKMSLPLKQFQTI